GDTTFFLSAWQLDHIQVTTPLVRFVWLDFWHLIQEQVRNDAAYGALDVLFALRSWQLKHDGRLPDRLEELVPSELERLPIDPYSGRPFGYVRAHGQALLPLGELAPRSMGQDTRPLVPAEGRLLYSVGPDRKDDEARTNEVRGMSGGDFIFPIP